MFFHYIVVLPEAAGSMQEREQSCFLYDVFIVIPRYNAFIFGGLADFLGVFFFTAHLVLCPDWL